MEREASKNETKIFSPPGFFGRDISSFSCILNVCGIIDPPQAETRIDIYNGSLFIYTVPDDIRNLSRNITGTETKI